MSTEPIEPAQLDPTHGRTISGWLRLRRAAVRSKQQRWMSVPRVLPLTRITLQRRDQLCRETPCAPTNC